MEKEIVNLTIHSPFQVFSLPFFEDDKIYINGREAIIAPENINEIYINKDFLLHKTMLTYIHLNETEYHGLILKDTRIGDELQKTINSLPSILYLPNEYNSFYFSLYLDITTRTSNKAKYPEEIVPVFAWGSNVLKRPFLHSRTMASISEFLKMRGKIFKFKDGMICLKFSLGDILSEEEADLITFPFLEDLEQISLMKKYRNLLLEVSAMKKLKKELI